MGFRPPRPPSIAEFERTWTFKFENSTHMIFLRTSRLLCTLLLTASCLFFRLPLSAQRNFAFNDPSNPMAVRVRDLLTQLTPAEKVSLLGYRSRPVERLGIPAYNWWNEALHGVARAGEATVYP